MGAGHNEVELVKQVIVLEPGKYQIDLSCGGEIVVDIVALGHEEVAAWGDILRCTLHTDCDWNKHLKYEAEGV